MKLTRNAPPPKRANKGRNFPIMDKDLYKEKLHLRGTYTYIQRKNLIGQTCHYGLNTSTFWHTSVLCATTIKLHQNKMLEYKCCCAQYRYRQKCLNTDKSLMAGLSKKIFSIKVCVCVYFELAKDQFGQSRAT